jgi:nucleoside-triphosphatase THEP1
MTLSLDDLSFPAPTSRAYTFDLSAKDEPYPYRFFVGRAHPQRVLRSWLLRGDHYSPDAAPHGGAALVTGFRGVGKSTLVDKVLYDVGLAGLLSQKFSDVEGTSRRWPFEEQEFAARKKQVAKGDRSQIAPRLYIPIHVDVANDIKREELLERVLRRTYHTLCDYEVGNLRPDVMQRARLVYLRSLGKIEVSGSSKAVEKLQAVLGATPDAISKMEVTATTEREFAQAFKFAADSLSIEETEDEVTELAAALSSSRVGQKKPVLGAALSVLHNTWIAASAQWREWLRGANGTQIHIVFVFDELDKLDRGDGHSEASDAGFLTNSRAVIQQLKIMFSTTGMSAVVIAGARAEEDWLDEQSDDDPVLRSIFGTRVYLPQLTVDELKVLPGVDDEQARSLAFRTRGRYKHVMRELASHGDERPVGLDKTLAAITGVWGATPLRRLDPDLNRIASARTIEELVAAVLPWVPHARFNAFGLDTLRSAFVCELTKSSAPRAASAQSSEDPLQRFLPASIIKTVRGTLENFSARLLAPVR